MIEVRIPKEITQYKEKLFYGLTLRQTICTVIALGVNVPLYIYGRNIIGDEAASWIVIIMAVPMMLIGYFKYNGMNFEKFLAVYFVSSFLYPQKRKYKTENFYENIFNDLKKEERENVRKASRNKKNK